eukprot:m.286541 g.286541  ORF g.286541 m.286541 type:complete len:103 (-) comp16352_c1_seq19:2597-2905(-)
MINNGGSDAHTVCGARLNEHLESALQEAQADPRNSQVLNYAKLPDILWETIFPKLFFYAPRTRGNQTLNGRVLDSPAAVTLINAVSEDLDSSPSKNGSHLST